MSCAAWFLNYTLSTKQTQHMYMKRKLKWCCSIRLHYVMGHWTYIFVLTLWPILFVMPCHGFEVTALTDKTHIWDYNFCVFCSMLKPFIFLKLGFLQSINVLPWINTKRCIEFIFTLMRFVCATYLYWTNNYLSTSFADFMNELH